MAKHPLRLRSRHVAQLRCVGALSVIAVIAGCNSGTPSPAASNALNVGSGAASPPCRHVRNTALDAALPVACQDQDLPLVRSLLARGADANARDKDGHTSLILAVNADNIDLVRLLLSSGAQAELTDRAGHRPIQYCENRAMQDALKPSWDEATENLTFAEAVEFSDTARVRDLLGSGTSADTYIGNLPALLTATEDGHVEVAKLLIKAGANTEWTDDRTEIERWFSLESPRWEVPRNTVGSDRPWHGTALTYAAMYGYPEIVRALIEARAKLDARDALGETPIFRAVNPECVKLLLKAGANVHARDLQGLTPLFSVGDGRCVAILVQAGDNPNAREREANLTPIFNAITEHRCDVVEALLNAGADVNARKLFGETPLDWALYDGDPKIVSLLKARGGKKGRR